MATAQIPRDALYLLMVKNQKGLSLFLGMSLALMLETSVLSIEIRYDDKDETTPNFWQRQPDTDFAQGGKMYCGPTAASNALMWFGRHGFPKLTPPAPDALSEQSKMIDILASKNYMNTADKNGTKLPVVICGIKNYVSVCGYSVASIQYKGINQCPQQYLIGEIPDLNWMAENTAGLTGQLLGIGWYKYDKQTNIYRRFGGHYLTVVGCEKDASIDNVPYVLLVHNPATGKSSKLYMEQLNGGTIIRPNSRGQMQNPPRSATGLYKVIRGLHFHRLGIIEGAIVFRLITDSNH